MDKYHALVKIDNVLQSLRNKVTQIKEERPEALDVIEAYELQIKKLERTRNKIKY